MSIFGLEIAVVQSDLVLLGRCSVTLLLLFFVLHGATKLIEIVEALIEAANESRETAMRAEIHTIEEKMDPEYDGSEYHPEPWEEWFHSEKVKGDKRLRKVETIGKIYSLGKSALVEYGLVCLVAMIAVISPTAVSETLEWLST